MKRAFYILLLLLCCVVPLQAQDMVFLTSDQGLSNTCIHSITEDSYHNVWITTRNGVNMYDGVNIRNYFHNEEDSTSLPDNVVTAVEELYEGKLLVGTNAGLCYYDYSTDSFHRVTLHNRQGEVIAMRIISITRQPDGTAFVSTTAGSAYLVSEEGGRVTCKLTQKYDFGGTDPLYCQVGRDGKVWVVNKNNEVAYFQKGRAHTVAVAGKVTHLAIGSKGDVYVEVDAKGILRFDETKKAFETLDFPALSHAVLKNIRSNGKGIIYICTDGNGLYLYHERTGILEASPLRTPEYSLSTANVEDAMEDEAGNLWMGIYWKGVVVLPRTSSAFEYVGRRSAQKNTLGTNCVTAIQSADDGWLWIGTDHSGLYRLSPDGTQSEHFEPGVVPHVPSTITAIHQDADGMLWLGSSLGGLVCMNPATGAFTPFEQLEAKGAAVQKVYSIVGDDKGNLWFATMGEGIFSYNKATHQIRHYVNKSQDVVGAENILNNIWVNALAVDGKQLYVGHAWGVDILRIREDGTLEPVGQCLNSGVWDFAIDDRGSVWAATMKGLYLIRTVNGKFETTGYTEKDGLSNNIVRSVELCYLPNGGYEVWASTDNGLNNFVPSTSTFRRFYIEDGLQGNEFTEHCSVNQNGKLVFGGINGLNYFVPSEVIHTTNEVQPQVRIVGLYLQGELVKAGQKYEGYVIYPSWINNATELHFNHDDKNIALELGTLEMFQNVDFEYALDGQDWVSLGNGQNRLVLSNLAVGQYTLRIRATMNGRYGDERVLTLVVHAPWYATIWMQLVYFLFVLVAVYLIYTYVRMRMRDRELTAAKRQEEEMAEARIQFFMNISHEIRTPMTLILAPLEKLRSMKDDEEHTRYYNLIYQNAQRILQLINQMMDVRKIEKGQFQLNYQRVEMVGFIKNLYELFAASSQENGIELRYLHEMDQLEVMADAPSLDKIVMNLLSNALKFTSQGGHVTLELKRNEAQDTFIIRVVDDGVGISGKNKERVFQRFYSGAHKNGYIGTGIGLNLTYLLVQLHKGEIRVMDNPEGKGTCFEVVLPCCTNELKQPVEQSQEPVLKVFATDKSHNRRHRNLLLVEDEAQIRQYLRAELSADFNVEECSNGMEAWEKVQRNPEKVDIILTDIIMPMLTGDLLCKRVKENFTTQHIPVILLSAKNTDTDQIAGISLGADAYLTKPFNVELIRTTALTILQNHQALQNRADTAKKVEEKVEKVEIVSHDEKLLERVIRCVNDNISNPELNVELLADLVGVSRVHFHRKLKELTSQTPRDFIRTIRLKQAERLLREKRLDITDVSIATGFKSLSTFSTCFKQVYGMTPKEYMNDKKKGGSVDKKKSDALEESPEKE